MNGSGGSPEKCTGITLNLLRIVTGFLFFPHGAQKLFGWIGGMQGSGEGVGQLVSLLGLAGVLEFFGGILIMLGLFTRQVAFILSGHMAVAYFMVHGGLGFGSRPFWPILNHGELAVVYSFVYLFLAANGGGDWSIDGLRKKGRGADAS
jgi:putative oxidoreductase